MCDFSLDKYLVFGFDHCFTLATGNNLQEKCQVSNIRSKIGFSYVLKQLNVCLHAYLGIYTVHAFERFSCLNAELCMNTMNRSQIWIFKLLFNLWHFV